MYNVLQLNLCNKILEKLGLHIVYITIKVYAERENQSHCYRTTPNGPQQQLSMLLYLKGSKVNGVNTTKLMGK